MTRNIHEIKIVEIKYLTQTNRPSCSVLYDAWRILKPAIANIMPFSGDAFDKSSMVKVVNVLLSAPMCPLIAGKQKHIL
jgi:hypothetical protein